MNIFIRILIPSLPSLMLSFVACADEDRGDQPSRRPTMAQMQASSMPSYKASPKIVEECLGRLVWTSDKAAEWPVRYSENALFKFTHSFSENVFSRGDEIKFGSTRISVTTVDQGVKSAVLDSLPGNSLVRLKKKLISMEAELKKAEKRKNGDIKERNQYDVAKSEVESAKKTIEEITT